MTAMRQEDNLHARLTAVWRRRQMLHAAAGLLAFCRWGIPLFLAGLAVDWLADLPAPARVVILVTLLAVAGYKAWRNGWRHLRAFSATHTALQVEERVGGLESLLVTAVQFQATGASAGTSESLLRMTRRKAGEAAAHLRAEKIVGFQGLQRPAIAVIILALIIVVLGLVHGPLLAAGAARIFAPWASVRYPTRTQLELVHGDLVVKEGDGARIEARVSGVIPRRAKLALRTGAGASRVHELAITNGTCAYAIETVFRGFDYRITAGDARSSWHTVQVIPAPRIERAEVVLEFPPYTERPAETGEALTVAVPENTLIRWRLTLDRAVTNAHFVSAGEESRPLEVSPDGRVVTLRRVATESRAYRFDWVEREHGFAYTSPRYYLQVVPDQRPSVELTAPRRDLYATVGRRIDLAFRGRDDFGIGESAVAYRVNKTGEVKVPFPLPAPGDGGEQRIDWDYRTVLPDLAVGDTVTFAVELADRYPGTNGPYRARSDARRVTFLSPEAYLEQILKQKQRLLAQLRTLYREERAVHDLVRRLDPSGGVFVQTCQLEAVRQDLIRERLGLIAREMNDLVEDLAANHIAGETHSAVLARLCADIKVIAEEHVGGAASSLRALAGDSGNGASRVVPDPAPTVQRVNSAARELGLLVLQLGYLDAAEVMARELHATAQSQASLRLKTSMPGEAASDAAGAVAEAQEQLAQSLARLLAATPREQESTAKDALVAFGLSRLAKQLHAAGAEAGMREAAGLIRRGGSAEAASLQAGVIQALLRAEFRLRIGSEYEALGRARELLLAQADAQKALCSEMTGLTDGEFGRRRPAIAGKQAALQRNLQMLLMPSVPAPRLRLFDAGPPSPPPVDDLLAAAEGAMKKAAAHLGAGDRAAAAREQQQAETSFNALAGIVQQRVEEMAQVDRIAGLVDLYEAGATKLGQFQERQLSLREKTDDAAADRTESTYLGDLQHKLLDDFRNFATELTERTAELAPRKGIAVPLASGIGQVLRAMKDAGDALRANKPAPAIAHQKAADAALEAVESLLADDGDRVAALGKIISDTGNALAPGPYVSDIESEQRDLIAATRAAQPADFAALVIPQKNLVHAVNAVLTALDPLAHKVQSGTGMMFAKTDMESAAAALESKDLSEALDAQTAVADSMHDLRVSLQSVTPQYRYILEITEFVHDMLPEAAGLRTAQGELNGKALAAADDVSVRNLTGEQRALASRAKTYGDLLYKATGQDRYQGAAKLMTEAASHLEAGDKATAAPRMQQAEDALVADATELLGLMKLLAIALDPSAYGPTPEYTLLQEVLPVAAQQRDLCIQTQTTTAPELVKALAQKQRAFEKQCDDFIPRSQSHPKLVEAKQRITDAANKLEAGSRGEAAASLQQAGEPLRHFILEYIAKYVREPPPPQASDAPSTDVTEVVEMDVSIFMPGAVSGKLPKTGRVEWEVLGRRERAALNENFARELPLEYRAILKDYYERLTR